MAFEHGAFLRQTVRCSTDPMGDLAVQFGPREGRYKPWWTQIVVRIHGGHGAVTINGSDGARLRNARLAVSLVTAFIVEESSLGRL